MFDRIVSILNNEGIERIGCIDIGDCEIINPRLLPNESKSVILFSIPYRSVYCTKSNDGFAEYARIFDYHKYASNIFDLLKAKIPSIQDSIFCFCDHSPINEKLAAAKADLGCIGRNSLFIDDVYGSFVFIGTIITNFHIENTPKTQIRSCSNCGLCLSKCPNHAITEKGINRNLCLSGISQKKKKNAEEINLLKTYNIVWGCDICQICCPHNINAKMTPIEFFKQSRISNINKEFLINLPKDNFNNFPFAYKGLDLILNNIAFK